MDHITLDSDCEIEEPNISSITIPDSQEDNACSDDGEIMDEEDDVVLIGDESKVANVSAIQIIEEANVDSEELFTVTFRSKQVFQRLGHKIFNVLKTALEQENNEFVDITISNDTNDECVCLKVFRAMTPEQNNEVDSVDGPTPMSLLFDKPPSTGVALCPQPATDKEQSPDLSDLSALFMIDTEPAEKLDTIQVPSYKRAIKDVLNEESIQKRKKNTEDECTRVRPVVNCFNCGSKDHSMRECHKPRNLKRISKAKKAFGSKTDRYHVDIEQRFAHLHPGTISDKLQSALGLRRGELPFFFYRMRVLGYPPGWLEDAKVAHSGITLFNSEGNAVLKPDEDVGEVDALNHKYDISKIVGFPGFNVDPGKNFYDDYKYHNVPPLNKLQQKDEFIKTLGDNVIKGYKRKKLVDQPIAGSPVTQQLELKTADMEIEDSEVNETADTAHVVFSRPMPPAEPHPSDIPPPPPTPPPPAEVVDEVSISNATSEERSQSPSLEDLEAVQLKLLHELQSNISNLTEPGEDSLIDEVLALEVQAEAADNLEASPKKREAADNTLLTPTTPQPPPLEPDGLRADIIKESHMGTPLLKFSPFDKLPDGENFKVGVSDVINFENLPDSTGKYEQMKVVIKKVRNKLVKLNNQDD